MWADRELEEHQEPVSLADMAEQDPPPPPDEEQEQEPLQSMQPLKPRENGGPPMAVAAVNPHHQQQQLQQQQHHHPHEHEHEHEPHHHHHHLHHMHPSGEHIMPTHHFMDMAGNNGGVPGAGGVSTPLDPSAMETLRMDHALLDHLDSGGGGFGDTNGAGAYPDHENSMMMMMLPSPPPPTAEELQQHRDDVKLPTAKTKDNYLRKYGRKLGLNDRGCYVACGLAILAFFLLIIVVALALSWPASSHRHTGPLHFCSEPACLEAAAGILARQNASYEPCKDFWQYACGDWLSRRRIPASQPSWSTVQEIEHSMRVEKSRLIAMVSQEPSQFNSIEWKVQHFYRSCMALSLIESDYEKPLIKLINNMGGWDVLRSFNMYSWDSHRVLRQLHSEHYVSAFFSIGVASDALRPDRNIIRIGPDGLGLPDKSYYHRLPDDPAVQAYQTFMKDAAQQFGASSPDAHKFSVDMFNFEKRLSEITPDADYLDDPVQTNNRMTVKDLHTMSMNIPWLEILKAAYSDAPITEMTELVVVSPQYAADIAVIISTTDRGSLNNYLMWRLAQAYMPYLSKSFREVVDLYRKSLAGVQKPLERWEFCARTTDRFFARLMDVMFAQSPGQRELQQGRQVLATKLFDYVKHNVAKSVSVSPHYDYASRKAAMTKLKNMTVQVGTPDFLFDRKYLKLMYNSLQVQKTDFFQNIQYGVSFLRKREELALVSPSDESRWLHWLGGRRVAYSPPANKVVVPEALLQPPLFHPGYPNAVNMGGLGAQLSEAVIRGVAGHGLLFDANGRLMARQQLRPPPSSRNSSDGDGGPFSQPAAAFDRVSQCLLRSYADRGVDTPDYLQKCRRQTAVDVAALEQAFVTLDDLLEMERGTILPAMETFDPQAVFFLTYAQSMCSQQTFKQRDIERTAGQRLLNQERLKGALARMPQFSHFFFCSDDGLGGGGSGADSNNGHSCGSII